MEHITESELIEFLTKASRPVHARVSSHLLEGCADCLALVKHMLLAKEGALSSARDLVVILIENSALLRDERVRAAARWARIADLEEQQRFDAIGERRGLRNYGLAAFVLDEAEGFASRGKTTKAAELVHFSIAVRESLPARVYGTGPLVDLQLRQQCMLGNIRRLQLDFPAAIRALERAEAISDKGIDVAEKARWFRVKASLLTDLGEFEQAAKAAEQVIELYGQIQDDLNKGRAIVQKAICVSLFDLNTALILADNARPLLASEPRSLLLANYTKCYCLAKMGHAKEAENLLTSQRDLIRQLADVEPDLWFKYVEALILKAKGQIDDADALLLFVALRFREEGYILPMLVQHLERIRIKAENGRWRSAVNIAAGVTPELAKLGLRADLLGMWASLQDALSQGKDVVNQIENLFRRRWNSSRSLFNP